MKGRLACLQRAPFRRLTTACRGFTGAATTVQIGGQMPAQKSSQIAEHGQVQGAYPAERRQAVARPRLPSRRCPEPGARCRPPHGSRPRLASRVNRRYLLRRRQLHRCRQHDAVPWANAATQSNRSGVALAETAAGGLADGARERVAAVALTAGRRRQTGALKQCCAAPKTPAPDSASRPRLEPVSAGRRRCRNPADGACRDGHC